MMYFIRLEMVIFLIEQAHLGFHFFWRRKSNRILITNTELATWHIEISVVRTISIVLNNTVAKVNSLQIINLVDTRMEVDVHILK